MLSWSWPGPWPGAESTQVGGQGRSWSGSIIQRNRRDQVTVCTWRGEGAPIRKQRDDGGGRQVVEQPFAREHCRAGGVKASPGQHGAERRDGDISLHVDWPLVLKGTVTVRLNTSITVLGGSHCRIKARLDDSR